MITNHFNVWNVEGPDWWDMDGPIESYSYKNDMFGGGFFAFFDATFVEANVGLLFGGDGN